MGRVGWRGFALARLQARYHTAVATLIVGTLLAAWHVPIFFLPQGPDIDVHSPVLFVDVIARSFIMTWLFNRSSGNVLITSLFHLAMNVFGAMIGIISYPALVTVEIALVIGLIWLEGPALAYVKQQIVKNNRRPSHFFVRQFNSVSDAGR